MPNQLRPCDLLDQWERDFLTGKEVEPEWKHRGWKLPLAKPDNPLRRAGVGPGCYAYPDDHPKPDLVGVIRLKLGMSTTDMKERVLAQMRKESAPATW